LSRSVGGELETLVAREDRDGAAVTGNQARSGSTLAVTSTITDTGKEAFCVHRETRNWISLQIYLPDRTENENVYT